MALIPQRERAILRELERETSAYPIRILLAYFSHPKIRGLKLRQTLKQIVLNGKKEGGGGKFVHVHATKV